jgi:hypothetical protein
MKTPYRPKNRPQIDIEIALLAAILLLAGCAFDLANIHPTPITLTPCRQNCKSLTITQAIVLTNITCGYDRTIKQGSTWKLTGNVPQGEVYKPVNACFTLECSNVFEAYLVLREKMIVGFYLPVEKGFVPLNKPTPLPPHQ